MTTGGACIRVSTHAMSDAGAGQHTLEPKKEEECNEPILARSCADVAASEATQGLGRQALVPTPGQSLVCEQGETTIEIEDGLADVRRSAHVERLGPVELACKCMLTVSSLDLLEKRSGGMTWTSQSRSSNAPGMVSSSVVK